MDIDFTALTAYQRYKLMASLIVPRPIALVTTLGPTGVLNAAPFSMFNMVGEDPPLVMVSVNRHNAAGQQKDTARNVLRTGEFVVHLPDEAIAARMHACAEPHPPEVSEVEVVGFTPRPSVRVAVPTIAEAPVAFECVLHERLENESRHVFFGRVLALHARDGLIDTERWRVRLQDYFPVGRFGASFYTRSRDRFAIDGDDRESRSTPIDEI
jgi:flavin reductase (DIM6/NTAB) family NADH-FMN oxidoreductase RutF